MAEYFLMHGGTTSPAPSHDQPPQGDDIHRLNFAWLIRLRWVAIIGQSAVILATRLMGEFDFPYPWLVVILFLEILSNLVLIGWSRTGRPRHESLGLIVLIADIAFLTALLSLTGGAENPFNLFYFIHVALAALVLRPLWTWSITIMSILSYVGLYFVPLDDRHLPWVKTSELWTLETQGKWVAFAVSAMVIAFFINMIQTALTKRENELIRIRDAKMRNEKLASLATLAAGAAHEFSTPLSTIALVASELQRGLEKKNADAHFIEDTVLIRDQVERCREILRQMSADAGESMGEFARPVPLTELIEHTLESLPDSSRVIVAIDTHRRAQLRVPPTAVGQALRGLVNNALEASTSDQKVELVVYENDEDIVIEIRDQGMGMTPEILTRAAEPFFTTKEAGQGMGLGVFLARTLVEKIGGRLTISSEIGDGTVVSVHLPGACATDQGAEPLEPLSSAQAPLIGDFHG